MRKTFGTMAASQQQAEWRRTGINFAETSGPRRPDEDIGGLIARGLHSLVIHRVWNECSTNNKKKATICE